MNFVLHFIHKKGYKNIDYRKLVTSPYNGFLKPVVYCRKNRCNKWDLIKTPWKNNEWKLSCDDKQKKEEITVQGSSWKKVKREENCEVIWKMTQPFIFIVTTMAGMEGELNIL